MKKIVILMSIVFAMGFTAKAQMELSANFGWYWGGHVNFYEGKMDMGDVNNYNITAGVPTMKGNWIELSYSYAKSTSSFNPYTGFPAYDYFEAKLNTHYILIGSYQRFDVGGKVEPFIGISLGAAIFDLDYSNYSNVWRFAGSLGGGLIINASDKIAIRLQGRLLMPMYFAGIGFYAGSGGSGFSLNSGSMMFQGDISAGLVFKIK
jgi:opacity protein-like surface antigen